MAEQNLFNLIISKVDGPVFAGDVVSVIVPGSLGEMTVLAHHEALISPLNAGSITVRKRDGSKELFTITSGILEVSHNQSTILI